jgi:hypothetical protein
MSVVAHVAPRLLPPLAQLVASYYEDTYRFVDRKNSELKLSCNVGLVAPYVDVLCHVAPGVCLSNKEQTPDQAHGAMILTGSLWRPVVRCRHARLYKLSCAVEKWFPFITYVLRET